MRLGKLLTRKDADVGVGSFDSVAWLFETKLAMADDRSVNSALVFGVSEDYPEKIVFYQKMMPLIHDKPTFVWIREN